MSKYQYNVVPFIGRIKSKESAASVSDQLNTVISEKASEGWEFFQLCQTNIEVSPGCLAGLFGAKTSYVTYDQIIFRKE